MQKAIIAFLLIITLQACNEPLKEFTLSDGMQLQLFSDSTFNQEIRLLERKYNVSGTWDGSIAEGSYFTTKTRAEGMQPEVITTYQIVNDKATLELSDK